MGSPQDGTGCDWQGEHSGAVDEGLSASGEEISQSSHQAYSLVGTGIRRRL